jgi:hypothetical protein
VEAFESQEALDIGDAGAPHPPGVGGVKLLVCRYLAILMSLKA